MTALDTLQSCHLAKRFLEHSVVEQDQGIERLGLGRCRDAAYGCQMIQKVFEPLFIQCIGVALAMKIDVLANPVRVAILSSRAVMPVSANDGDQIKQTGWGLIP